MCETTKATTLSVTAQLLKIFTPCLAGNGNKTVFISVFDKYSLMGEMTTSISGVMQTLNSFFNGLHTLPGLPADVSQTLHGFTFEVQYENRDSSEAERNGFGMLDFPVYLASTEGPTALTPDSGKELLVAHRIPETVLIKRFDSSPEVFAHVFPYGDGENGLESFINDPKAFGIGISGSYFFPGSQSICRKIGFVKVNKLIENIPFGNRQPRFIAVMKHELGHILGLLHKDNTIMHPDYDVVVNHEAYTVLQCQIISTSLTALSQGENEK